MSHETPFRTVYDWASLLTAEQRGLSSEDYLYALEARSLLRRLKTVKGQLIAVVGNQGTGKTALRDMLCLELQEDKIFSLKWSGADPIEAAFEREGFKDPNYQNLIIDAFIETLGGGKLERIAKKGVQVLGFERGTDEWEKYYYAFMGWEGKIYRDEADKLRDLLILFEKKLGQKRLGEIRNEHFIEQTRNYNHILIDFPDYDKRQRGQMIRDLRDFQEWWESLVAGGLGVYEQEPNVVVFFQRELWGGHFLFGKFSVIELKPFPAPILADYYVRRFGSSKPFNRDALELLARLGRGIFRWFKKYVGVCLDHYYDLNGKGQAPVEIGAEQINEWITIEQLIDDWERELSDLFPKSKDLRKTAVIVLRYVAEHGAAPQPDLVANIFDGAEMPASRVLAALEGGGYIERGYEGRQKIVKISRMKRTVL